jgi:CO/xanthine dehydrogenase Mo-binding subunit
VLVVLVDGSINQACNAKLVDVNRRRMGVVEDLRMPKVVVWWSVEGFFVLQTGEKNFGKRPAIVKVVAELLASDVAEVRLCHGRDGVVRVDAGTHVVDGSFASIPTFFALSSQVLSVASAVDLPRINNGLMPCFISDCC